MMGPKTLREIREELRQAFGAGGDDPIQRLDQLIADAKRDGEGGEEVLESLRRVLEAGGKEKQPGHAVHSSASHEPPMRSKHDRIKAIGFTLVGSWRLGNSKLEFDLNDKLAAAKNVLYAFVAGGELMYVGKTTTPLQERMGYYKNATKSTNLKNNRKIRESLAEGKVVEIHVLPDNGLLYYGGFHVNLAAGLEDSLIRDLNPPWNGRKKESPDQSLVPLETA